jgi:ABC-type branched-subunit amino acid transport system ATPase component
LTLLRTDDLTVSFGGVHALSGVHLTIEDGDGIVGLIGPNGAGKTTFIDAVTGFVEPSAGIIEFLGHDITHAPPHQRAQRGLLRTFQSLELFEDLTVEQNLSAAAERTPWWQFVVDAVRPRRSAEAEAAVDRALELLDLTDDRYTLPGDLSHGRRRLVGMARALAARPQLLLLDEPAAGLDTTESQSLGRLLRVLADTGTTILLIDHDMGLVLDVCDTVHVLDFGQLIAHGTPDEVRRDPGVVNAYLGASEMET